MMIPGTMKDNPQAVETKTPAMREPRMFPTEVWEFHTPMMKPRLAIKTEKVTRSSPAESQFYKIDSWMLSWSLEACQHAFMLFYALKTFGEVKSRQELN